MTKRGGGEEGDVKNTGPIYGGGKGGGWSRGR